MIPGFEAQLRCPLTGDRLSLADAKTGAGGRVRTGRLVTEDGIASYPIKNYVPVFAGEDDYADSFGRQWTRWTADRVVGAAEGEELTAHYRRKFSDITGFDEGPTVDGMIVEIGSGSGMFVDAVRATGARYVGLDLSRAVFSAQERHLDDPGVQFVKADAFSPPLARNAADAAFSIGVFHHTPEPGRAAIAMLSMVRPGGRYALSVYSEDGYHGQLGIRRLRAACSRLDPKDAETLAAGYGLVASKILYPVFGLLIQDPRRADQIVKLQRALFPSFNDKSAVWRAAVLYDAITPAFASTHSAEEVAGWIREGGAASMERRPWPSIAFSGRMAANPTDPGQCDPDRGAV